MNKTTWNQSRRQSNNEINTTSNEWNLLVKRKSKQDFLQDIVFERKIESFSLLSMAIADATTRKQDMIMYYNQRVRVYFEQKNYQSEPRH